MTNTETPTDTTELTAVVDAYLASLSETDPDVRAALVAQAYDPAARFVDPLQDHKGHDALAGIAPAVNELYPGATFRRTSGVDAHHEFARFGWELVNEDGSLVIDGIDVCSIAPDGRLAGVAGFFGDLPSA